MVGQLIELRWIIGVTLVLGASGMSAARGADNGRVLFDFKSPDRGKQWAAVNDGVMGGVSEGRFRITDSGTMVFYGNLSLENNGGFASVRSRPKKLELGAGDYLMARVRGDGRVYTFNLYVPTRRTAFSYRSEFKTTAGEWTLVTVPLKDFEATSFGRRVPNAGPVNPAQVNSLGFLLSDKKPGPFKLEIDWIKTVSAES